MGRLLRQNLGYLAIVSLFTAAVFGALSWLYVSQEVARREELVVNSAERTLINFEPIAAYLVDYYELDLLHQIEHSHELDPHINYIVVVGEEGGPILDHRPLDDLQPLMTRPSNREFQRELETPNGRQVTILVGMDPSGFMAGLDRVKISVAFLAVLCTILVTAIGVVLLRMKTAALVYGVEIKKEREAKVMAESVSRARSEFLANMSHEIRTPLNGVVGIIELLSRTSLEPVQKDYLIDLATSSRTLMGLLDQVLDAARIDAGKFNLEYSDADPARLLRNTLSVFRSKAAQKGVELRSDIGPTVPSKVVCDPMRLQQVLNNLVGNALKFTEAGEVSVCLASSLRDDGRADLRFTVSDSGIGIPDESLATIFEPFTQAEGHSARKHGGTGLGLAICSKIIDLMGGTIVCRNRPEGGAEFEFDLVLEVVEVTAPEADLDECVTDEVERHLEDVRVLVAEDNPLNQKVIRLQLGSLGLNPVMAANGREAIQAFRNETFDIILMDCQMPLLDGYSATRAIRRLEGTNSHVPIIATTANAMPGDMEKCLEAGMDGFLAKPIKSADLARTLDQWLAVPAV